MQSPSRLCCCAGTPMASAKGTGDTETYQPTTVHGVWLSIYLVIDVWSRKVVAWDVAERELQPSRPTW